MSVLESRIELVSISARYDSMRGGSSSGYWMWYGGWRKTGRCFHRNIHILLADLSAAGMVGDARAALVDDEQFAFLEKQMPSR